MVCAWVRTVAFQYIMCGVKHVRASVSFRRLASNEQLVVAIGGNFCESPARLVSFMSYRGYPSRTGWY